MNTRRQFLITAPLGILGAINACKGDDQKPAAPATPLTPGAPPAFTTGRGAGPPVTAATFAEAQKLVQVDMSDAERDMAAKSWRTAMASLMERRAGPKKIALEASVSPATQWDPRIIAGTTGPQRDHFVRSNAD